MITVEQENTHFYIYIHLIIKNRSMVDTFGWYRPNQTFESEISSDESEFPSNILHKTLYNESSFLERALLSCWTCSKFKPLYTIWQCMTATKKQTIHQHTWRKWWVASRNSEGYFVLTTNRIFFAHPANQHLANQHYENNKLGNKR